MRVILFGATGMIGEGALIEALEDPGITAVTAVVRRATRHAGHPKLTELIHRDFLDYGAIRDQLGGHDVCLYCLGISSAGMSEGDYTRITRDFAVAAGNALLAANPGMRLCFISGAGTDAGSRRMWQRVKGETELEMMAMPWGAAHMFRPAGILPVKGVVSGVRSYRVLYATLGWTAPLFKAILPDQLTDTAKLGQAMIEVARSGHQKAVLEGSDINALRP